MLLPHHCCSDPVPFGQALGAFSTPKEQAVAHTSAAAPVHTGPLEQLPGAGAQLMFKVIQLEKLSLQLYWSTRTVTVPVNVAAQVIVD
jgi:hypothetical protein